jgi:hypothetical protein
VICGLFSALVIAASPNQRAPMSNGQKAGLADGFISASVSGVRPPVSSVRLET